jgi:hypothetical protein
MKRREFIAGVGSLVAWPMETHAQQQPMPVIGYFSAGTASDPLGARQYYHRGLAEIGYVEGRNVTIGHLEKLLSLPGVCVSGANAYESKREQSGIICRQFRGA